MKPQACEQTLQGSGIVQTSDFKLSIDDAAQIMTLLREVLYTDAVLAVIREYSSNAWDVHQEYNVERPIKVVLPTLLESTFSVRDYGPGLSSEDVFQLYPAYGKSTKRDSNVAVGMMGIGCKSAFAYADTFTVTSWYEGVKSVYVAALDTRNIGVMHLLNQEPCGDESGLEISVPVKPADVDRFHERARTFYPYVLPTPEINVDIPSIAVGKGRRHIVPHVGSVEICAPDSNYYYYYYRYYSGKYTCVMGCIPYKIDLLTYKDRFIEAGISDRMFGNNLILNCPIGSVEVSASREELRYTEKTLDSIEKTLLALQDGVLLQADEAFSGLGSNWDKFKYASDLNELFGPSLVTYAAKVPAVVTCVQEIQKLTDSLATSVGTLSDGTFTIRNAQTSVEAHLGQRIHPGTAFILLDTSLAEYRQNRCPPNYASVSWLFVPTSRTLPLEELEKSVRAFLCSAKLDGAPLILASSLPTHQQAMSVARIVNKEQVAKYSKSAKMFVFTPSRKGSPDKASDDWVPKKRIPTDQDVYLPLHRFVNAAAPRRKLIDLQNLCEGLGLTVPTIVGYKTDDFVEFGEKPGIPFRTWEKSVYDAAAKSESLADALLQHFRQADLFALRSATQDLNALLLLLEQKLGSDHLLCRYVSDTVTPSKSVIPKKENTLIQLLSSDIQNKIVNCMENSPRWYLQQIYEQYPLFNEINRQPGSVLRNPLFLDYVLALDYHRANVPIKQGGSDVESAVLHANQ